MNTSTHRSMVMEPIDGPLLQMRTMDYLWGSNPKAAIPNQGPPARRADRL